ncbi:MAG: FkbM family methyltransferase, partial [Spirochaetaceae bacterium]
YALFAAALLAALTDFVDGILARREERRLPPADEGLPRFGAVWDAETDAAFMLALSTIVFAYTPVGAWILAIGAMRYLFDLLFILLPEEPEWPRGFRRFSKTVCAVSVGTLVGALYPAVSHATAVTANSIALALLLMSFGWETVLRVGGWGMLRTLLIYYGIPLRQRRLRRLYSLFIRPGDVAFDIGAHVGNRVRAWRALGAWAVAVEPQPSCLKVLRALYGRSPRIHIEPVAVGASEGSLVLYICDDYPTLSTVSPDWINQVTQVETFSHINWNRRVDVPVRTLDSLIAQYGHPSFVKIDVEGHEPQVLSGLSRAVPALSFEFLPASIQGALTCIDMVEALGDYEYNYAMVETARLREPAWVSAEAMREILRRMPPTGPSGDVYARLVDENRR